MRAMRTTLIPAALLLLGALLVSCGGSAAPEASGGPAAGASAAPSGRSEAAPTPTSLATGRTGAVPATRERAEVVRVSDGDTIRVRLAGGREVPVRYIGIDTPETVDPRKDVQCYGREASAFNAKLVAGKTVELEKDVSETDKYDRLLRYVWADGKMVNEELVRGGYARSSAYPPDVKYQDRFRALEAEARQRGIGLWAADACAATTPASAAPLRTAAAPAASAAFSVVITASSYGTITASTSPGASCTAAARLPSGSMSTAQGLRETRTADATGVVRWSYGTSGNTRPGTGTHTVTCSHDGASRSAGAEFTVR